MPKINLSHVSRYICNDINMEILDKEMLVLLGPNGAGKTTVLNIIAGLCPYQGSVDFDDVPVDKVSTVKRRVGYLFQDLYLFPHLDVAQNIAYGLLSQKWPQHELRARINELLDLMHIEHLVHRFPINLSGGEKQKVALARALAPSPQILLLDEPLSSVDRQTSKYLRTEIKQLQRKLGVTAIYVTHDLNEAEEMADRIAVINHGKIEQVGTLQEILFFPGSDGVSAFIGQPNILEVNSSTALGNGAVEAVCGDMRIIVPYIDREIQRLSISPVDIYISRASPPGPDINRFKGQVSDIVISPNAVRIKIITRTNTIIAEVSHRIYKDLGIVPGQEVYFILKLRRIKAYYNGN